MLTTQKHTIALISSFLNLSFLFFFSEFFVAADDDSGMKPKLLCDKMEWFYVLVQAHRVPVLSHSEREVHGFRGFRLHYSTLNDSVWEGKCDILLVKAIIV